MQMDPIVRSRRKALREAQTWLQALALNVMRVGERKAPRFRIYTEDQRSTELIVLRPRAKLIGGQPSCRKADDDGAHDRQDERTGA